VRVCKNSIVAFHFPNVHIPQNAKVEAAYLVFALEQRGSHMGDILVEVSAEYSGNAAPFVPQPGMLSQRDRHDGATQWRNIENWGLGSGNFKTAAMSVDPTLAPIFARTDWKEDNALVVMIKPRVPLTQVTCASASPSPTTRNSKCLRSGSSTARTRLFDEIIRIMAVLVLPS
jgi:hypothetical protein